MDLFPVLATFLLILVGELGDKTQLTVISLSSEYKAKYVFLGAMLAFLAVDGVSIIIGGPLLAMLPMNAVRVISGIVFVVFGTLSLVRKDKNDIALKRKSRFPIFTAFSLIALLELGDKSQIITITLAAQNPPLMVLVGLMLAFTLLTGIAVLIGAKLLSRLPMKWVKIVTSTIFIVLGIVSIVGALLGVSIL
jgi:putative Ca2+/H+ antiporter (TMEM165/GDT1 family)